MLNSVPSGETKTIGEALFNLFLVSSSVMRSPILMEVFCNSIQRVDFLWLGDDWQKIQYYLCYFLGGVNFAGVRDSFSWHPSADPMLALREESSRLPCGMNRMRDGDRLKYKKEKNSL